MNSKTHELSQIVNVDFLLLATIIVVIFKSEPLLLTLRQKYSQ